MTTDVVLAGDEVYVVVDDSAPNPLITYDSDVGTYVIPYDEEATIFLGSEGPMGPSAYAIALANGFSGTESEWLTSLKAGEIGFGMVISGGDRPIVTGIKGDFKVPFNCTLKSVEILSTTNVGHIVVDVWRTPIADFPPDVSDSIVGPGGLTLTSAYVFHDTALTGWTINLAKDDILRFYVSDVATMPLVTVSFSAVKT